MIDFQIDGEFLEMPEDGQVTINLANPLFAHELQFNSHSYKFSIGNTNTNRKALKFIDHALAANPLRKQDAQAWLGGVPWKRGQIEVTEGVNHVAFPIAFEENAAYRSLIENTLIKDLPLQSVQIYGAATPGAVLTIDLTGANGDKAALLLYDTVIWTTFITGMSELNVIDNMAQRS